MRPGDLIDGRFEILREAGAGGMGIVYQARDRRDGTTVALKVLAPQGPRVTERFTREASVLAQLDHPAIVAYLAHGGGDDAATAPPYLVMEWLEGEDLGERLTRGPLPIDDAIMIATQIAAAAGAAHRKGFVHRDLKPSNVFLVGGAASQVKVLDFGLVRELVAAPSVTATGIVLGTVGYLSPEQARGAAGVDARADVFSIGCILYECLTGRPAFSGVHAVATLAKLLVDDVPRVRETRADVPSKLDALVARMLEKTIETRPADGDAVAEALRAIRPSEPGSMPSVAPSGRLPALTAREQRVMAVILVGQRSERELSSSATSPDEAGARTMISLRTPAARLVIEETMARFDGSAVVAADGTVVATVRGVGPDQAANAARCALALGAACPGATIALAVGRGIAEVSGTTGEVIERAAALLAAAQRAGREGVHVETSLAPILEESFVVDHDPAAPRFATLHGERTSRDGARVVLGRVSPFVGRARELDTLDRTLTESIVESTANAIVVAGAAGAGKSRLTEELLHGAARRHPELAIALARAEAIRETSVFGVAAALVRQIAKLHEGEPASIQAELASFVAGAGLDREASERITQFVAELLGCPLSDDASVELRAARQSSALMRDQIARAWVDLLGAKLADGPLLVVVEDAHWIDDASLDLLDTALREHGGRPLAMVLLGRPELETRLPSSWRERGVQTLRLSALTPRAATELARRLLPDGDRALLDSLAERSGGNPFVLEELVRAHARGAEQGALPDTVLALVQSRLLGLDPNARRTLRAASVFGRVAKAAGVAALLGEADTVGTEATLRALVAREVLDSAREPGAFSFRHDLVRDAAYAMLTDADRASGHALAGEWLEETGEPDVAVLALHFERGGDAERAAKCFVRAAEQAFEGNALRTAITLAERAIELGAEAEMLGRAKLAWASARRWLGAYEGCIEAALDAARLHAPGSARFFAALTTAATVADVTGRYDGFAELIERAIASEPGDEAAAVARIACLVGGATGLHHIGEIARGEALGEAAEREAEPLAARHPLVAASIFRLRTIEGALRGDGSSSLAAWRGAAASFRAAGERRGACVARTNAGFALLQLGINDEAEFALREALVEARELSLIEAADAARHNLGLALARRGRLDEALVEESVALASFRTRGNARMIGGTLVYASIILLQLGDLERAEEAAREAVTELGAYVLAVPTARAQLARVLVARGRLDEAIVEAEAGFSALQKNPVDEGDALIRLVHAEALLACGRAEEARVALRNAHAELESRAARIADPAARERFRRGIPDNARTIDLLLELDR